MDPDEDSARGLVRLQGYLVWNAEVEEARRRAARFTGQLPWLTTAQREDVERVYTADRLAASRATLRRVSARAAALRGEYEARYRVLKARCVATGVVFLGAVGGTCTALTLLTR
ncbi:MULTISPECIES: hypothetical protein [unclassified Streptomyces]|uniref:hypothetical protein n=1 Tax=unclassified Streptomyces TaxID=2593676 RepID=UPI00081B567C|nr:MULTISPECIES: hypothetical protein [unclassified Streptomyces]MYQ89813.1 hypothetical protein [Streptomyces sp. SID4936]SCE59593.1 hypothetical protein GA0115234_1147231 [Streptomyces sp. DvalAA-43]